MGFVRSTCQGQVKTASVREEARDERMVEERRGQLESESPSGGRLMSMPSSPDCQFVPVHRHQK